MGGLWVIRMTSSKLGTLNKNKQARVKDDSDDTTDHDTEAGNLDTDTAEEMQCTCGSEKATHSRSCPMNPRNYSLNL